MYDWKFVSEPKVQQLENWDLRKVLEIARQERLAWKRKIDKYGEKATRAAVDTATLTMNVWSSTVEDLERELVRREIYEF